MIKCDFCVTARYDNNGKVYSNENLCCTKNCADAIRIMSEVMKEEYRTRNSKNINKNYNYKTDR